MAAAVAGVEVLSGKNDLSINSLFILKLNFGVLSTVEGGWLSGLPIYIFAWGR